MPQTILITGASSGIGRALSLHYAASGCHLLLHGRNQEKLTEVATLCEKRGAKATINAGDITHREDLAAWIARMDNAHPIDLVIANAGISAGSGDKGESLQQVEAIFSTNIDGVIHTVHPFISRMATRRKGQIVIISSLAGVRALPSCPAYSASKACVKAYGEALRGLLASSGVGVCVVCPGYIHTAMTEKNNFPMPFIMTAEKAARIIAAGVAKNRGRIAFPRILYIPLWLLSCLSPRLTDPFFSRLPAKPSL